MKLTGRVVYRGDPGWDEARKNFNQRFDVQPRAVVFCQDRTDVVNALQWARANNMPVRARSGRHSYEGYSLVDGGLIIDVSEIDHVRVDREAGVAEIGAGIWMLECTERLGDIGVATPLATGPTVGIAGLALGGGFGLTSRKFGLTCDNVVEIEMVTAGGEVVRASDASHPDLFWACRGGGGGNFGISTQFSLRVHPISVVLGFIVQWDWSRFEPGRGPVASVGARCRRRPVRGVATDSEQDNQAYGMYTPDKTSAVAEGAKLLAPLLQVVPPASPPTIRPLPFIIAARMFFGEGGRTVDPEEPHWTVHVHSNQQIFKSTSAGVMTPLPAEAIAMLRAFLENPPPLAQTPVQVSMVQLLPGGGAPSRIAPNATAVYLRDARLIIQYDGYWMLPQDAGPTISWVEQMRSTMQPYAQGAYVNYVDSSITNPLRAYYGPNLERLVRVKQQYDPENVFNFPQSIPLRLPG